MNACAVDFLERFDRQQLLDAGFSPRRVGAWRRVHTILFGATKWTAKQRQAVARARTSGLSLDQLVLIEKKLHHIADAARKWALRLELLAFRGTYAELRRRAKEIVPAPPPNGQVAAVEPPPAPAAARPVPRIPVKPPQAAVPAPAPPPPAAVPAPPAAVPPPSVAAKPPAIETPEPRSSGRFQWPVRGTILSEFGPKPGGLHNDGLNISAPKGTPVVAAENGVVAYAGNELRGFGNLLLIRHADGWMSAYAHLDEMTVDRGATVKRGQKIGTVGSTGNVSSPQLHFELRKSNRAMDPRDHLSGERRVSRDASPDGRPSPG